MHIRLAHQDDLQSISRLMKILDTTAHHFSDTEEIDIIIQEQAYTVIEDEDYVIQGAIATKKESKTREIHSLVSNKK